MNKFVNDETRCIVCGSTEDDLVQCEICGELVCSDSDSCSEVLNEDQFHCKKCLSKQTRYDCYLCKNQYTEKCPLDSAYSYCYDCPEYQPGIQHIINVLKQEGINSKKKAIELLEELKEVDPHD